MNAPEEGGRETCRTNIPESTCGQRSSMTLLSELRKHRAPTERRGTQLSTTISFRHTSKKRQHDSSTVVTRSKEPSATRRGPDHSADTFQKLWGPIKQCISRVIQQVHSDLYGQIAAWLRKTRAPLSQNRRRPEVDVAILITGINTVDSLPVVTGLRTRLWQEDAVHVAVLQPQMGSSLASCL